MVREMRRFWKNVKSKQAVMGAIIICLMLAIGATSYTGLIPQTVKAEGDGFETQAVGDYTYNKGITISSTLADTWLTGFPVWIYNISSDFADHILANGSDIGFYDSTNTTRFPHEIDTWNKATGELGCWVNVSSISPSANTIIYMYYGDSDTPDQPGYNPNNVWDEGYKVVYHMNSSTATVYDSTSNENHGTKTGANNPEEVTTGKCGNAQDFEDATSDKILTDTQCCPYANLTVEYWIRFKDVGTNSESIVTTMYDTAGFGEFSWVTRHQNDDTFQGAVYDGGGAIFNTDSLGNTDYSANAVWYHVALVWDQDNSYGRCIVNETIDNTQTTTPPDTMACDGRGSTTIGAEQDIAVWKLYTNSSIDEVRISNVARNRSWINSSYRITNAPATYLTFGEEQGGAAGGASSFTLVGLPNNRITWAGTAGTTVWCNTSGDAYETIEVNLSVNASDNISELRFWIGDLNDTSEWINASNLSIVFSSDNSTWKGEDDSVNTTSFTDGGSNVSVNTTQWTHANGMYGTNPFTAGLGGITDTNISIWARVKLTIPSGASSTDFWAESSTAWKIYIGYYT